MDRGTYLMEIAQLAQSYGFVPIPVWQKIPRFPNWQNVRYDPNNPGKNIRRVGHLYQAGLANNVGILTGSPSGVVVFDIEVSDLPWWQELVRLNGGLPETFTVRTGSGGEHIYFKYTQEVARFRNMNKILGRNVDYRTVGGHVVFPGSEGKTGQVYAVSGGYREGRPVLAEMPSWLVQLLSLNAL